MENEIASSLKPQVPQKKGKGKFVVIIILILLVLGIGGYIVYDKILNKQTSEVERTSKNSLLTLEYLKNFENSGLQKDDTKSGRFVYVGDNPDNYIQLESNFETYELYTGLLKDMDNSIIYMESKELCEKYFGQPDSVQAENPCTLAKITTNWRIMAVEADGSLKVVNTVAPFKKKWDTSNASWDKPSYLNSFLNTEYYNSLESSIKKNIIPHSFNIGTVKMENDSNSITKQERQKKWVGKVGLINLSDLFKASDFSLCTADSISVYEVNNSCLIHNYIINDMTKNPSFKIGSYLSSDDNWLLTSSYSDNGKYSEPWTYYYNSVSDYSMRTDSDELDEEDMQGQQYGVTPVIYLKSGLNLTGTGTSEDPFKIVQ